MKREALGLIEVYGYLGAIEAADAALKSANVRLIGNDFVTGGIVTVKVEGDVAAVQASVEAAHAAVERLGVRVTSHVIPRPTDETWKIIVPKLAEKKETPEIKEEASKKVELPVEEENAEEVIEKIEEKEEAKAEEISAEETEEKKEVNEDDLEKKTVAELRQLARKLKLPSMTNKQIKFAKKDKLIDEIRNFYRRRDS